MSSSDVSSIGHDDSLLRNEPGVIPKFSLRQAVLLNLLFLVIMLGGWLVVGLMPVDVYPDVDLDEATVETFWPGASAEDVERLITDRIETKIEGVRGVNHIVSDSKPDASLIRVKFREDLSDTELDAAFRQLSAAIELVTDLPEDTEKPIVTRISVGEIFPLLWVAVKDTGGVGEETLHDIALRLKPWLRDVPGVAKVDDKLIRDREVHVAVDPDPLRHLGMTLDEVAEVLRQYNRTVPSGTLPEPRGEFSVRAVGEVVTPEQLAEIAVRKDPGGGHVYLGDLATITTDFERKRFFARLDGHDCKALAVAKTPEADSRGVSERVRDATVRFQESLPSGIRERVAVEVILDSSDIIRSRIGMLLSNLVSGIGLVFLSLWAVIGTRNAILAVVGIPFAFLLALILMHLMGVTISAVSLFALVLCSGVIVDDEIVMLENIYRHLKINRVQRPDLSELQRVRLAIVRGAHEVMWPVMASSATTVVAFLPLLLMTGILGEFFAIIPKTVAVVLIASQIESMLMLPMHYLHIGPRRDVRTLLDRIVSPRGGEGPNWAMQAYDRLLRGIIRYRYWVPLPLLGSGALTVGLLSMIPVDLFPSDFQLVAVDIHAHDEASLDQMGEMVKPFEQIAMSMGGEYVHTVLTAFGIVATDDNAALWRNNLAQLQVQLANSEAVRADPDVVARELRERMETYLAAHPECAVRSLQVWAPQDGPPIGKPVSIRIESGDLGRAKQLAERFKARLSRIGGVFAVEDDLDFGPKQVNLRLNEDLASAHRLTQPHLSMALRTANDGLVVSSFKDTRSGEDLDVRVMLDASNRRTIDDLLNIDIRAPGGYLLRLGDICELDMGQGYAGIPHRNGKRVVTVSAQIDTGRVTSREVHAILGDEFRGELAGSGDLRVVFGGEYGETVKSFEGLFRAGIVALVVVYMLLATQFHSYVQPFIVMLTVPFTSVAVVVGLLVSGYPFTIMTFIAIVGMTGVVVNDSIVLLDFVNRATGEGRPMADAVREACLLRVRPVLMTTITTVVGVLPLALGWGGTSKVWSPFAASFAWGLTFSTMITLLIEPAMYCVANDGVTAWRRWRSVHSPGSESAPAASPAR
ncbi:MAG: efflux RND transporter permease subunit [Phycisphaerales bacterium]|nr:efflux RND transporter permease subunit [Phycisphaerales bacterium]